MPRNIQLLESFPEKIFVRDSLKAVQKWRFKIENSDTGVPVKQTNLTYTMQFQMAGHKPIQMKEEVLSKLKQDASAGNANAQFSLGYVQKKLNFSKQDVNPNKWFLKAAIQGQRQAQYQLGKSLVFGQGCIKDKSKGVEWLVRSATSGNTKARELLARVASKINTLDSHRNSLQQLSDLKELSAVTKLDYAWLLASSPYNEINNPKKALKIIKEMSDSELKDNVTRLEIKAAVYASLGNFKKAINYQKEALKEAEDMGANLEEIKYHLQAYQKDETYKQL